jgi:transcriptional regulator with XRE-family HTH domain
MKNTDDLLGLRLRQLMEHHGLVEAELSRRSGIPMITISRLKTGHTDDPRLSTLQKLASFFCISLSQLVGEEPLLLEAQREQRRQVRIPLFYGDQWKIWTHEGIAENCSFDIQWIYTDQLPSNKGFAIQIDSDNYGAIFPKGSTIFIDADTASVSPCYVLVTNTEKKDFFIAQKTQMMFAEYLVHPLNTTLHIPLDHSHCIMGTISGIKIYYSH